MVYVVVTVTNREKLGQAIAEDNCGLIDNLDWSDFSQRGDGVSFAEYGEAVAFADGRALNNLLHGTFVKSTAYFVFDTHRVRAGGFLADYWVHGPRIADRVLERVREVLAG